MNIGDLLPSFTLTGTDDKAHNSSTLADKPVLLIMTCNHCPHARAYVKRIKALHEEFGERMGFFAINPNDPVQYPEDSFENMKPMAEALGVDGRYLFDEAQHVARSLGATRTPEAFLFDAGGRLAYHGAIDDNEREPHNVQRRYLQDAINAVLENREVDPRETKPVGCTIKWRP